MQLHSFYKNSGVKLLDKPENMASKRLQGNILAYNLVKNPRRKDALDTHISHYYWHRRMVGGFLIKTSMAAIEEPGIHRSFLTADGKVLLNGAAGDRARNHIRKKLGYTDESSLYLKELFDKKLDPSGLSYKTDAVGDVYIEAKNYFNFFHFLTESLHKAFISDDRVSGRNTIRFVSNPSQIEGFAKKTGLI